MVDGYARWYGGGVSVGMVVDFSVRQSGARQVAVLALRVELGGRHG